MREKASLKCRKCGKRIMIIIEDLYKKTVVDPGVVWVVPDPEGKSFVRIDGSKLMGREARYEIRGRRGTGVPDAPENLR